MDVNEAVENSRGKLQDLKVSGKYPDQCPQENLDFEGDLYKKKEGVKQLETSGDYIHLDFKDSFQGRTIPNNKNKIDSLWPQWESI